MKATGIVRRIDDLGRVVIPKEIRRTLRIREGDPLEIFTDKNGEVIFKKYSPIGEIGDFASGYAETLSKNSGFPAAITDKDTVIAVYGVPKKDFVDKKISEGLEKIIEGRKNYAYSSGEKISLIDGGGKYNIIAMSPIVSEGDIFGSVLLLNNETETALNDSDIKLVMTAAGFLSKNIE